MSSQEIRELQELQRTFYTFLHVIATHDLSSVFLSSKSRAYLDPMMQLILHASCNHKDILVRKVSLALVYLCYLVFRSFTKICYSPLIGTSFLTLLSGMCTDIYKTNQRLVCESIWWRKGETVFELHCSNKDRLCLLVCKMSSLFQVPGFRSFVMEAFATNCCLYSVLDKSFEFRDANTVCWCIV